MVGVASIANGAWIGGPIILLITWTVAGSCFLLAQGLWRFENWARLIVMILLGSCVSANLVLSLVDPSIYGTYGGTLLPVCGALIAFLVGTFIITWFAAHGEYFK